MGAWGRRPGGVPLYGRLDIFFAPVYLSNKNILLKGSPLPEVVIGKRQDPTTFFSGATYSFGFKYFSPNINATNATTAMNMESMPTTESGLKNKWTKPKSSPTINQTLNVEVRWNNVLKQRKYKNRFNIS